MYTYKLMDHSACVITFLRQPTIQSRFDMYNASLIISAQSTGPNNISRNDYLPMCKRFNKQQQIHPYQQS